MPHRRRAAVTTALLTAWAALASGCDGIEIEIPAGSLPAPVSIAPIPSASAGQPAYVCTAVYKVLTEGAVRLAEHTVNDDAEGLKRTFADMAAQIAAAGDRSTDAAQRAATDGIADALTAASRGADPKAFLNGDFTTIGQRLDGTCT
ncbi:hypothetical protein Aph02nite_40270 [Actinoplanes philippinensis]|uniref:Lipoprotein n=1 Tax=Actinoplanes philippinensis TaxID=35752 RepID=A0A1I2GT60_9ACTN|nr:hypothetical protein [Actinoplanes philippinensis]GIE78077.1 hypothetical protein Aph02nite_40270 [Actinoplanes philippinensis]SFF20662.1 hypothetical protein SAMN05421541_107161 [Actinoplanes philippinensis]